MKPRSIRIDLIYFDAQDVEVGRSEVIAHGDTWSGTIPSSIAGWRREPSQAVAFPIYSNSAIFLSPENRLCAEPPPAGLLIMAPSEAEPGEAPYEEEIYMQRPPVCTVDPSCPLDSRECWPYWVEGG